MANILGLGMSHYPGLLRPDMTQLFRRTLSSPKVPEAAKDPRNWPAAMREEWGDDQGASAAVRHRERCFHNFRVLRERLDAFRPDAVVIFGDDQYENFTEDIIPPFCAFLLEEMESRPFQTKSSGIAQQSNAFGAPADTVFRHQGAARIGRWLVNQLADDGIAVPYAYRMRYPHGLAHAFINTLMFLDVDRRGFQWPLIPFHVNCYGGDLIRTHGGMNALAEAAADRDPPAPSPTVCFDMGRAVARALARSPWRVALIASSSWSHAFLTAKTHWLQPDLESDRALLADLRSGQHARWRELKRDQLEAAGQHELLNWVTLAGAMSELGQRAEIVDWVESYIFNSAKCFAVFH